MSKSNKENKRLENIRFNQINNIEQNISNFKVNVKISGVTIFNNEKPKSIKINKLDRTLALQYKDFFTNLVFQKLKDLNLSGLKLKENPIIYGRDEF